MLRAVDESDLTTFFEHQRDAEAAAMAAFPSREWDAFLFHWRHNILGNPGALTRTVVAEGDVAGYVGSWEQNGRRLVAYWMGREFWGRGLASAAVGEFLRDHERHRPIHAYVAQHNAASIRVLEKCGFVRVGGTEPGPDGIVELLYVLEG